MAEMPKVTAVSAQNDFSLMVTFANGEVRRFDMRPYLERGIFVRLKNLGLFCLARVELGTVAWPGDLDMAPETLYLKSSAIEDQSSVV